MEKFKSVTSFLPRCGFDHILRGRAARVFHRTCLGGEPPLPKGRVPCRAGRHSLVLQQYYQILLNNSDVFAPQIISLKLFFVFTALIKFPFFLHHQRYQYFLEHQLHCHLLKHHQSFFYITDDVTDFLNSLLSVGDSMYGLDDPYMDRCDLNTLQQNVQYWSKCHYHPMTISLSTTQISEYVTIPSLSQSLGRTSKEKGWQQVGS